MLQFPTDWYEVELEDQDGRRFVHAVYTPQGFENAANIAKNELDNYLSKDLKIIRITRILREATLSECMQGGQTNA